MLHVTHRDILTRQILFQFLKTCFHFRTATTALMATNITFHPGMSILLDEIRPDTEDFAQEMSLKKSVKLSCARKALRSGSLD